MLTESWETYDKIADRYEERVPFAAEFGRQLVDFADVRSGMRLLDVGSGTGVAARVALARGCQVTAVDMAPRMVQVLRATLPEITAERMNAKQLSFPDNSFEVVIASYLLDIIDDPVAVVAEMRRVLVPHGVCAVSMEGPIRDCWRWFPALVAEYLPDLPIVNLPEPNGASLLAEAGFGDVEHKLIEWPTPIPDPAACWNNTEQSLLADPEASEHLLTLPEERATELRTRVLAGAERMYADGNLVRHYDAILYRAKASQRSLVV